MGRTTDEAAAPRPLRSAIGHLPRWWLGALITLAVAYFVLTVAVLVGSPVNSVDEFWYHQHLIRYSSPWHGFVTDWVTIGRRAPATVVAVVYIVYRTLATRSWRPWVLFAVAWFGFNASVGAMKYLTGRQGPRFTSDAHTLWAGGDIFPSGHVTGAVVIYGVMAMVAPIAHRRLMTALAVLFSVTVGFGTIALNTHWLSDVIGGWINGGIVLLISWALAPWATAQARSWAVRIVPALYRYIPVFVPWRSVPTAWRSRSRSTR